MIVYDDDDIETKLFLKGITCEDISIYEVKRSNETTLGCLRNYAIEKSRGQYVCQWDDDDWYHTARLEYQFEATRISGFPATIMAQWLIFDSTSNRSFVSHKRLWEGSLLCEKSAIAGLSYDDYDIGEDTSFVQRLDEENKIYYIEDVPNLYIYVFHGENTWDANHWNEIFKSSFELDSEGSRIIAQVLSENDRCKENSLKIDTILENSLMEGNGTIYKEKIPKIIHLIYKDKTIPELYQPMYRRMRALHPEWEITVYDDSSALEIVKQNFPEILQVYESYPCDVQRTDMFRMLIVYLKGGFYLDLDMYCLRDLDELCQYELILGEERTISFKESKEWDPIHGLQVANYMFGSVPAHPFWIEVLLEGIIRSSREIITESDVLETTGPWLLSEIYHNKKHEYNDIKLIRNKFRICLNHCETISCYFGGYAAHFHSGSWQWQKEGSPKEAPINGSNRNGNMEISKVYKVLSERLNHGKGLPDYSQ
ncbi:MAG: hypothetical protein Mars2KO_20230 [Maribacter sp.]